MTSARPLLVFQSQPSSWARILLRGPGAALALGLAAIARGVFATDRPGAWIVLGGGALAAVAVTVLIAARTRQARPVTLDEEGVTFWPCDEDHRAHRIARDALIGARVAPNAQGLPALRLDSEARERPYFISDEFVGAEYEDIAAALNAWAICARARLRGEEARTAAPTSPGRRAAA
jgi:hypothetical protein